MRSSVRVPARPLLALTALACWLLAAVAAFAPPAGAHTAPVPVELTPPVGAELAALPAEMAITFDGDFTDDLRVELLDIDGRTVPTTSTVDGRTVTLRLAEGVESTPGTYRLSWSVRTTHGADAKDGVGAESRQVHFFVGDVAQGRPMVEPATIDASPAGDRDIPLAPVAVGGLLAIAATVATVDTMRIRVAVIALVALGIGGVVVANSSGDDAPAALGGEATALAGELPGDHVALLHDDGPWLLDVVDSQGLASQWATAAQLRFTQPDHTASRVVDMTIDIGSLGRFRAEVPESLDGWDAELVLSSFEGPVVSFVVPTDG